MFEEIKPFLALVIFGNIENLILAAQGVAHHVNPLVLSALSLTAVLGWFFIGTFATKFALKYARVINFLGGLAIFILGIQAMAEAIPGMMKFFI